MLLVYSIHNTLSEKSLLSRCHIKELITNLIVSQIACSLWLVNLGSRTSRYGPYPLNEKRISLLSKMSLKGNLQKALLESRNLNESLNVTSGRSVSLNFFRKRCNKYSMNLIFSGCTMKLQSHIFSTWIHGPSTKSLGHKSLWKKPQFMVLELGM